MGEVNNKSPKWYKNDKINSMKGDENSDRKASI